MDLSRIPPAIFFRALGRSNFAELPRTWPNFGGFFSLEVRGCLIHKSNLGASSYPHISRVA